MSTPSCWGSPTCSEEWCCANHLLINHHKTKFVLFGVRQLIPKLPSNITVPFLGQDLVPVTSAKDLGVTIDANLTFDDHIASLTSLASSLLSKLVQINRVRHLFAKEVMCIILNSLVFSKLFYCATVWFGAPKENIHKLQLIQNFAGRILTNTKKFITLHQSYMNLVCSPSKSYYAYVM